MLGVFGVFGKLFSEAYNRVATVENTIKDFNACSIEPFNPNIFSDHDFASTKVTERPIENVEKYCQNNIIRIKETGPIN